MSTLQVKPTGTEVMFIYPSGDVAFAGYFRALALIWGWLRQGGEVEVIDNGDIH